MNNETYDLNTPLPILVNSDSYKGTHYKGYPFATTKIYSYIESRGGKYDEIVNLGMLFFIHKYLKQQITKEMVDDAEDFWMKHVGCFNRSGWDKIVNEYDGYLPVTVKSLAEGTVASPSVPLITITNNDPDMYWLTSFLETAALRAVWYPSTVASRIRYMKKKIIKFYQETADTLDSLPFALLDFSGRGNSSLESALYGSYAYLTMFMGSDTASAVYQTSKFFKTMTGYSVPATEHSIMCAYGQDNEKKSFVNLIDKMGQENGVLSVVSDTWNIFDAAHKWVELKDEVRNAKITLVVRPDSGDIQEVLPKVLKILEDGYGYTVNSKGFKVLKDVKVLWGDGIDEETCTLPFQIAKDMGISSDSVLIGSGGGLMQANIDRDTSKFAMKASAALVDNELREIAKNPITDSGKKSKAGIFRVYRDNNHNLQWSNERYYDGSYQEDLLRVIYSVYKDKNNKLVRDIETPDTWEHITNRVNQNI